MEREQMAGCLVGVARDLVAWSSHRPISLEVISDFVVKLEAQVGRLEDSKHRLERIKDEQGVADTLEHIEKNLDVVEGILKFVRKESRKIASNGLNGMSNRDARKFVNSLLSRHTSGYFKDQGWAPIHKTFKELERHGVDYSIESADYGVSKNWQDTWDGPKWRIPNDYKEWKFVIQFENDKGRPTRLWGVMTAHGAGSTSDPLERYDVTAYVS